MCALRLNPRKIGPLQGKRPHSNSSTTQRHTAHTQQCSAASSTLYTSGGRATFPRMLGRPGGLHMLHAAPVHLGACAAACGRRLGRFDSTASRLRRRNTVPCKRSITPNTTGGPRSAGCMRGARDPATRLQTKRAPSKSPRALCLELGAPPLEAVQILCDHPVLHHIPHQHVLGTAESKVKLQIDTASLRTKKRQGYEIERDVRSDGFPNSPHPCPLRFRREGNAPARQSVQTAT